MTIDEEGMMQFNSNSQLSLSSSLSGVNYSCGTCGYELNLNSSNRNSSIIGSKHYGKSLKKGILSFFSVDETRFTLVDQLQWRPFFISAWAWGLLRRHTKLLCRKCGNHIGDVYKFRFREGNGVKWDGISGSTNEYQIRIRALQPSSHDGSLL